MMCACGLHWVPGTIEWGYRRDGKGMRQFRNRILHNGFKIPMKPEERP